MVESGQSLVGHAVGAWCWHARHAAPCRVVDRQDMWGETAYRVWLPTKDAVVRARSQDLAQLDSAPFDVCKIAVFSAHVMGGAKMGDDAATSVVRSADLRHHSVSNLHVVDGSVFPTSLGVNPQESIYGLAHLMSARFVAEWKHA